MIIPVFLILLTLFLFPVAAAAQDSSPGIPEQCLLKPVYGHCKANMEIHSFNTTSGRCEITYGCPEFTPFQTKNECQNTCEKRIVITQSEYALLETLLKTYDISPWWHIEKKTIAKQLDEKTIAFLGTPGMPGESGISLDEAMTRDFNDKNKHSYTLSPEFTAGKNTVVFKSSRGIRTIAVSRPALNADGTQAIIFLQDNYRYPPEVFMQEGFFLLFERSGDTWKIRKQIKTSLTYS